MSDLFKWPSPSNQAEGWPPLDYSEHGLPDGVSFEGEFPGGTRKGKTSLSGPPFFRGSLAADTGGMLDYSEKGLPDSDMTYDQFSVPWSQETARKSGKKSRTAPSKVPLPPKIPDIEAGMGRSQDKKDRVALADYAKKASLWPVYKNILHRYNGRYWEPLDKLSGIRAVKEIFLGHDSIAGVLNERDYKEIYESLLTDPILYTSEPPTCPTDKLNCSDGILDLSVTPPQKLPHTPEFYFQSVLNLSCDDILDPPTYGYRFESFVEQAGNGDPNVRQQLLELTAIALTGLQLKHFFVLLGPSDSGKSQWGRFLLELLGRENIGTVRSIDDFGDKWTVGSLAGKRLALCMDLPNQPLSKAAIGILKQFCGSDAVKAELKYANSFVYYEKPLLLLAGNHPIRVPNTDKEEAFLNRMVIIPFSAPPYGREKIQDFYQLLLDEAPYIVHEAIDAYQALVTQNYELTRSEIPQEYQTQEGHSLYGRMTDFVARNLVMEQGAEITTSTLYEVFCTEYVQEDIATTVFSKVLSQVLRQMIPAAISVKRVSGTDLRGYKNLAFTSDLNSQTPWHDA